MFIKTTLTAALTVFMLAACSNDAETSDTSAARPAAQAATPSLSLLDMPLATITGDTTTLRQLGGKALLVVNTASKCGYTPQYAGLEALYETYKDSGLVVVGFPANNFGNQEPGSNERIHEFCTTTYDVTFPMMAKISVKGDDKNPLYVRLTEKSSAPGEIEWNFTKFLIDRDGKVVARFASAVKPQSDEVVAAVTGLLKS